MQSIALEVQRYLVSGLNKYWGEVKDSLPLPCHFPFPPLVSRNTPCSPNMFQTHHGRFSGTGRP